MSMHRIIMLSGLLFVANTINTMDWRKLHFTTQEVKKAEKRNKNYDLIHAISGITAVCATAGIFYIFPANTPYYNPMGPWDQPQEREYHWDVVKTALGAAIVSYTLTYCFLGKLCGS